MARASKRLRGLREKLGADRSYALREALELCKECASASFDETVEMAVNLGVNVRQSDQVVRGAMSLPGGHGKAVVRVAVFAEGTQAEAAREAGADAVGHQELADKMRDGDLNYDVVLATPEAMPLLGKLSRVLGPKGLMPNPKVGTVSRDVARAVKDAKTGQVRYCTDKNGIVHCAVGRVSFDVNVLEENVQALLAELKRVKPSAAKGVYLRKISLSSTMGPGLQVDQAASGL